MDLNDLEHNDESRAKWLADWDARHAARKREERSDFRWMIAHCVLLTLAIGGMLVKLAQDLK